MKLALKQRQRAAVRGTWIQSGEPLLLEGVDALPVGEIADAPTPLRVPVWHKRQGVVDVVTQIPLSAPPADSSASITMPSIARFNHDALTATRREGFSVGAGHNLILDPPTADNIPDGKLSLEPLYRPRRRGSGFTYAGEPIPLEGADLLPTGELAYEPAPLFRPPWHPTQGWLWSDEPLLLEGQDEIPGTQADDPNPLRVPDWHLRQTFIDTPYPDLEGEGIVPGTREADPSPLRRPDWHLRQDWIDVFARVLVGADVVLVDGQQFVDPLPRVKPPVPTDWVHPTKNTTFQIPPIVTPEIATYGRSLLDVYLTPKRILPQHELSSRHLYGLEDDLVDGRQAADPNPLRTPPWHLRQTHLDTPFPDLEGAGTIVGRTAADPNPLTRPSLVLRQGFERHGEPVPLEGADLLPTGELSDAPTPLRRAPWHPSQAWIWRELPRFLEGSGIVPGVQADDPNPLRRPSLHLRQDQIATILPLLEVIVLPTGRQAADPTPLRRPPLVLDWIRFGEPVPLEGADILPTGELAAAPTPLRRIPLVKHQDWLVQARGLLLPPPTPLPPGALLDLTESAALVQQFVRQDRWRRYQDWLHDSQQTLIIFTDKGTLLLSEVADGTLTLSEVLVGGLTLSEVLVGGLTMTEVC